MVTDNDYDRIPCQSRDWVRFRGNAKSSVGWSSDVPAETLSNHWSVIPTFPRKRVPSGLIDVPLMAPYSLPSRF
jgi:hypothetical protein